MEKLDSNDLQITDKNVVKHVGIVSRISKDTVYVSLKGAINCEGCKAKAACGISDSNDKIIEIQHKNHSFGIDESVTIFMNNGMGLKAVFLGYVFPFILVFITLIISASFFEEWLSGLVSLFVLVPYYLLLFINKNALKKSFTISAYKNK